MLGNLLNESTTTIFPVAMAAKKAAELAADDADWTYTVALNPADSTKAVIEIRDEDGMFIGYI